MHHKLEWPDGRVGLLRQLWGEGHSASRIAAMIGEGITRSAVLGKVHRLHLNGRTPSHLTPEEKARRRREYSVTHRAQTNAAQRARARAKGIKSKLTYKEISDGPNSLAWMPPKRVLEVADALEPDRACSCTILELTHQRCRYVLGEPNGIETLYCGQRTVEGQSYCPFHYRKTHGHDPKYTGPRTFTRPKAEHVIWRGADGRWI
jgi:GcrA cell cycle regulator